MENKTALGIRTVVGVRVGWISYLANHNAELVIDPSLAPSRKAVYILSREAVQSNPPVKKAFHLTHLTLPIAIPFLRYEGTKFLP